MPEPHAPAADEAAPPPARTEQRDIVVVGASAGGVEALAKLVRDLPAEFPASIFVVLHLMPTARSVLPDILDRAGPLPAGAAADGDEIDRGRIYVAPPDQHLLLTRDGITLTHGPRENGHRPAVDPLFRSAARAFGERVIAVVLSGSLDDGTAGLRLVKRMGGATVAQEPEDALYPSMPSSAVANGGADYVVALADMPALLSGLVDAPMRIAEGPPPDPDGLEVVEAELSDGDPTAGDLSGLTCPECGGALWEHLDSDGYVRFKCHVGHAYSPESLETAQSHALEMAMWAALRTLDERGDLFRRLARRTGPSARLRFETKAEEVARHSAVLRQSILRLGRGPVADEAAPTVEIEGG